MDTLTIVGCQFGDEGKGKIIDYLSCNYDMSIRFNGGENAGHTVVTEGNTIKYHLVPAGFLRARTSVIANGVVINLRKLNEEIDFLSKFKSSFDLKISNLAHIVTDIHIERDKFLENLRGKGSIGTTLKGIGPAYESKFGRYGIRLEDFKDPGVLKEKLEFLSSIYNIKLRQGMAEDLIGNYDRISKYIVDTSEYLRGEIDGGSSALFETAQGTFIDVEFGTYPFVTSSHTITGGVTVGTGLSPKYFGKFLGVAKAYTTRVGEGYFPTELEGEDAEKLRKLGNEYGATTGRPRRIGYLDIPMLRRSVKLNSLDYIALTKTDVLGKFKNIKVGVSYIKDGSEIKEYDPNIRVDRVEYVSFDQWDDNRKNLNRFIEFIEEETGVPVALLGSGEKREDIEKRLLT